jgi:hypothetical protein
METLKHNRHYIFLYLMYLLAACQIYDLAMYCLSKAMIQSQGFFEVGPFAIAFCALIGTAAGGFIVGQIFKGIDNEVENAIDYVLEKLSCQLTQKVNEIKEEGGNE